MLLSDVYRIYHLGNLQHTRQSKNYKWITTVTHTRLIVSILKLQCFAFYFVEPYSYPFTDHCQPVLAWLTEPNPQLTSVG